MAHLEFLRHDQLRRIESHHKVEHGHRQDGNHDREVTNEGAHLAGEVRRRLEVLQNQRDEVRGDEEHYGEKVDVRHVVWQSAARAQEDAPGRRAARDGGAIP